jgi:hypothetical protein
VRAVLRRFGWTDTFTVLKSGDESAQSKRFALVQAPGAREFVDYFSGERFPVNPAIVRAMRSKEALLAAARILLQDFCGTFSCACYILRPFAGARAWSKGRRTVESRVSMTKTTVL